MRTERSRGSDEKASDDGEGFGGDAIVTVVKIREPLGVTLQKDEDF
jgi:hypothetical protein